MFKKLASEALGLSDIGVIVPPSDFGKVDADDYLFNEDGEKIFFLIKSKKDEYCFTNLGLIHVDGDSAVSSKRSIKRYDYSTSHLSHVMIETAGTIGDTAFSIDVRKNFIEPLKDIYKALITIGKMQTRDELARTHALQCLGVLGSMYKVGSITSDDQITQNYNALVNTVNSTVLDRFHRRDFSPVFERYIHN
jgi:hypothetical protein